jgi:oligopeptide transport system substrate-binding protein
MTTALSLTATLAFAQNHPVTNEPLAEKQVFVYRVGDDSPSIDPQYTEDVDGAAVVRDLFEGLMTQDKDGNLAPGVATDFDLSEDKTVYTFHLRDTAKWSDGTPVTAADFEYSWKRLVDPATASPYAWFAEEMGIVNVADVVAGKLPASDLGVKAIDDHTFEVRLSRPVAHLPQMTTNAALSPSPKSVVEAHGTNWTKPENIVSNGAYILTEAIPQERSVRVRNTNYWNNDATIIERVEALVINDENAALTRYLSGELDRTEVPAGQFKKLSASNPDEALSIPTLCTYYYFINMSDSANPALKDQRVREALSLAIDRDVITGAILQGGQTAAFGFTPEATAGFTAPENAAEAMTQKERDARAIELLTEAGYGPDKPITLKLLYNTDDQHKKIAITVSQMWKQKLGVTTELQNMEWKTFLEARSSQQFDIGRAGWCGDYNMASAFLDLMRSGHEYNDAKYSNAEVDALLEDARVNPDPSADFTKIEEIIAKDVPILPIYHYAEAYMMDKNLQNWPVENVQQNWYSRDLYFTAE